MELTHSFTVPVGIEDAWRVLTDIERIAPCMPGARIDSVEGEEFSGQVKVKVGPMQVTYRGDARFTELDSEAHRAQIEAHGKEARGSGTAQATITAQLVDKGEETDVSVVTDLAITGKPAQFGRGVMDDVGNKLLGRFADCLASELAGGEPEPAAAPAAPDAGETAGVTEAVTTEAPPAETIDLAARRSRPEGVADSIDLLDVAGAPVARRLAPVAAVALLAVIIWLVRRRR